jgi:hypothetical protein
MLKVDSVSVIYFEIYRFEDKLDKDAD